MQQPIVVYSTASFPPHPLHMIYTVITGALKYAEHVSPGSNRAIEIRLLPLTVRDWIAAPAMMILRPLRDAFRQSSQTPSSERTGSAKESFAARAIGANGIWVRTATREVQVVTDRIGPSSVSGYVRALAVAYRLWRRCFSGSRFDGTRFLDLTHDGVLVGDLAASEHLRWVRRGDGQLRPSLGLFLMLADCVFICCVCDKLEPPADSAVFVLEPTYRHSVYQRALHQKCVTQIDIKCWEETGFTFVKADEGLRNCYRIAAPVRPLNEHDRVRAECYLAGRLADPVAHIGYLDTGHNDNSRWQVTSSTGEVVGLDAERLHAAVFLHSFDDAQYLYGNDGFVDLVDWAIFTIEACLANPRIGSVLIKPHPASWNGNFPNTRRAEHLLMRRFENVDRLVWLEKNASLVALAVTGNVVGITHHGSVAEELVYLSVPVIAYRHAAWAEGYDFVRGWSSPDEYRDMLLALSPEAFSRPSEAERESLLTYVKECRLVPGRGEFDYFFEFRAWLASAQDDRRAVNNQALESYLEALSEEEACRFMDYLIGK